METDELGLPKYFESNAIHVTALIIADYSFIPSHWLSRMSLSTWLKAHNIPAIHGLDTRMLTKKIRVKGSLLGKIIFNTEAKINFSTLKFRDPNLRNLVAEVSRRKVVSYGKGRIQVIAVDCGMKNNIIRVFMSKGVRLKVVPWDYDFNKEQYDGMLMSMLILLLCYFLLQQLVVLFVGFRTVFEQWSRRSNDYDQNYPTHQSGFKDWHSNIWDMSGQPTACAGCWS